MKSFKITEKDYIKAVKKVDRENEITEHGKQISLRGSVLHKSKRTYSRKNYRIEF